MTIRYYIKFRFILKNIREITFPESKLLCILETIFPTAEMLFFKELKKQAHKEIFNQKALGIYLLFVSIILMGQCSDGWGICKKRTKSITKRLFFIIVLKPSSAPNLPFTNFETAHRFIQIQSLHAEAYKHQPFVRTN